MINNSKNSFNDTISFIPKERKLKIDEILKKTEKDIEFGSLETVSFEEFRNIIFEKGRMFIDGIDI